MNRYISLLNLKIWIIAQNFSGSQVFGAHKIYKNLSTKNNTLRPFQLWTRARIKILCKMVHLPASLLLQHHLNDDINLPNNALQIC